MGTNKIITIGFETAADAIESDSLTSKISLLDWDIVIFRPDIGEFLRSNDAHQGKPSLNESRSFQLRGCCNHWNRELQSAFDAGKTVLIFLSSKEEVFVHTGEREFSGTGRNRQQITIVDHYDNYKSIPVTLKTTSSSGTAMKLLPGAPNALMLFWNEFKEHFEYHTILEKATNSYIVTKTADKPVSAMYKHPTSSGVMLLVPDIDFYGDKFIDEDTDEWTAAGEQFGARLLSAVVALDKGLREADEVTPEPAWASVETYSFESEGRLRAQFDQATSEVAAAKTRLLEVSKELDAAGRLRGLLYEKGRPLELLIISALRIMGFRAEPFKHANSEFDVVFESTDGRLIGEVEGKDSRAINVDKLRQLMMNVQEDLQREEVQEAAKSALFGNAFRLTALEDRGDPFTKKCVDASSLTSTALVATPDLFWVARYLSEHADDAYALACRRVLLTSVGRVKFPSVPTLIEGTK